MRKKTLTEAQIENIKMRVPELKPCPFCGMENINEIKIEFVPALRCFDCGATITLPISFRGSYKIGLAQIWNTRKPIDKVVEQLEEQQNYCKENAYKSETLTMLYHEYNKAIDIVKQNLSN